jgi:hypothetical protein
MPFLLELEAEKGRSTCYRQGTPSGAGRSASHRLAVRISFALLEDPSVSLTRQRPNLVWLDL